MTRPAPDQLSLACLDSGSVNMDWSANEENGDEENGERRWESTQAFDYEYDPEDSIDGERKSVVLVARGATVLAAWDHNGVRCDVGDWDDYRDRVADDEGELPDGAFTEADADALAEVEPYQWGAGGPMMNYYYPLGDSPDTGIGAYGDTVDDIGAAYRIRDTSLCLVLLDGEDYALALTGGGMDMTWSIVRAFVALGYAPPTKFCSTPGFRESDSEYLAACMRFSLTSKVERINYDIERLDAEFPPST